MMRRKVAVALAAMIMFLTLIPISALAAVPSVQEVETLISQIGTVTRENRSAVENAVNAYNQLDDASKAAVSNYAVLKEAQQVLGIKDALAKLEVEYDKVDNDYTIMSPSDVKLLDKGSCGVLLTLYVDENEQPRMVVFYDYVGENFVWTESVVVRAGENKYTYDKDAFSYTKLDKVKLSSGKIKCAELNGTLAEDFDFELLRDALSAKETIIRFTGHEPSLRGQGDKTEYDYVLTPQNRQSITDVLYAYDLMCAAGPEVTWKALA